MPDLTVHLDEYATAEEVAAVEEAVRSSGLSAEVDTDWRKDPQTGNGAFWMVAVVVGIPMYPFVRQLATRAADDAYDALKSFVGKLREARRSSVVADGYVEFVDPDGTQLMIGASADVEEAFDKLREIGPDAWRGKHLRWDEQTREWVPY